ncbi:TPA: AAA family ATPase [Legionella pneumophila subsp. pneumophila]|nr:AAA family ATPase [Legionella pneumophila subsp. pneumophila]
MRIKRLVVENVRSFLDKAELILDGKISIIIGPNGGGKTNLLDILVIMLRRYLYKSMYAVRQPRPDKPYLQVFRENETLSNMTLERHTFGQDRDQYIEIEIEVTEEDIQNMVAMQKDSDHLTSLASSDYSNLNLKLANNWELNQVCAGQRFSYCLKNDNLIVPEGGAKSFLQYLQLFEMEAKIREEYGEKSLTTPLVYLPVNRTTSNLKTDVQLSGYEEFNLKRDIDSSTSRSTTPLVSLAVGRLAQKYRLLLEQDKGHAQNEFKNDENIKQLSLLLGELGYNWDLKCIDPMKNHYDIKLVKDGLTFLVGSASSGERELLTYLFAIYALNVRDALIIIDEAELHLHPKWQKTLVNLFIRLSEATGNQFVISTHSPTFISSDSIQYVSRVFSKEQKSHIVRLNYNNLPEAKHLLKIINSQNNERIFFADEVVLVEGISDRIFFEALFDYYGRSNSRIIEIINVDGKKLFNQYKRVLEACSIKYSIIADLDYAEDIGSPEVKALFQTCPSKIKKNLIQNNNSKDSQAFVHIIDNAIQTQNWDSAKELWSYIKNRHKALKTTLSPEETFILHDFIEKQRDENCYILKKGSLEAYLPIANQSKDIEKLITLICEENFIERLPNEGITELEKIIRRILPSNQV